MLISKAYKFSTLIEELIITLRNQLGKEEVKLGKPENIEQLSELTNSANQALLWVGIDLSRYPV